MLASIPCNLCHSTEAEQVRGRDRHGKPLRSVICRQCGLVWTDPRPSPDRVREFYVRDYRLEYKGILEPKPQHTYRAGRAALARLALLRPALTPGARLLDVGAGGGEFVYVARALGYDAHGLEPNEGFARYAAQVLSVPVRQGVYQTAGIEPASQQVVTMFHTVEHLEDPFDAMRQAHGWLTPGGLLVIEIPNVEAICQQPHQQFHHGHLYHFNLTALEHIGRSAGYDVASRGTSPDGGNIWAIFERSPVAPPERQGIPGNYARVRAVLDRHTALRHACSRHPYLRPLNKLRTHLDEWRHIQSSSDARAILDALIARSGAGDRIRT